MSKQNDEDERRSRGIVSVELSVGYQDTSTRPTAGNEIIIRRPRALCAAAGLGLRPADSTSCAEIVAIPPPPCRCLLLLLLIGRSREQRRPLPHRGRSLRLRFPRHRHAARPPLPPRRHRLRRGRVRHVVPRPLPGSQPSRSKFASPLHRPDRQGHLPQRFGVDQVPPRLRERAEQPPPACPSA